MTSTTTLRAETALSARRVRAFHNAQGRPDVPELGELWNRAEAEVDRALATGDHPAARRALARYEAAAVLAIRRVST